jgi:hypothetical protein
MESHVEGMIQLSMFTEAESRALWKLRACYQQEHARWSAHELAQLRFLRWLYRTGRLGLGHDAGPRPAYAPKEVISPDMLNRHGI